MIFFRLGEGCTHISGLLFSLEANTNKLKDVPCTSKHCVWNKGGKRKKEPRKVSEIKFKKIRYGEDSCGIQKKKDIEIEQNSNEFFVSLTSQLGNSNSTAALFDLIPPNSEHHDISDDLNVARFEEVSTSEYVIQESDKYLDLLSIVKKENLDENGIIERLSNIPIPTLEEIERRTIGQNENALWKTGRQFRITSSNFQQIFKRQKENVDKLLVQFSNKTKSIETPALQWGRKRETIARKKICCLQKVET